MNCKFTIAFYLQIQITGKLGLNKKNRREKIQSFARSSHHCWTKKYSETIISLQSSLNMGDSFLWKGVRKVVEQEMLTFSDPRSREAAEKYLAMGPPAKGDSWRRLNPVEWRAVSNDEEKEQYHKISHEVGHAERFLNLCTVARIGKFHQGDSLEEVLHYQQFWSDIEASDEDELRDKNAMLESLKTEHENLLAPFEWYLNEDDGCLYYTKNKQTSIIVKNCHYGTLCGDYGHDTDTMGRDEGDVPFKEEFIKEMNVSIKTSPSRRVCVVILPLLCLIEIYVPTRRQDMGFRVYMGMVYGKCIGSFRTPSATCSDDIEVEDHHVKFLSVNGTDRIVLEVDHLEGKIKNATTVTRVGKLEGEANWTVENITALTFPWIRDFISPERCFCESKVWSDEEEEDDRDDMSKLNVDEHQRFCDSQSNHPHSSVAEYLRERHELVVKISPDRKYACIYTRYWYWADMWKINDDGTVEFLYTLKRNTYRTMNNPMPCYMFTDPQNPERTLLVFNRTHGQIDVIDCETGETVHHTEPNDMFIHKTHLVRDSSGGIKLVVDGWWWQPFFGSGFYRLADLLTKPNLEFTDRSAEEDF